MKSCKFILQDDTVCVYICISLFLSVITFLFDVKKAGNEGCKKLFKTEEDKEEELEPDDG